MSSIERETWWRQVCRRYLCCHFFASRSGLFSVTIMDHGVHACICCVLIDCTTRFSWNGLVLPGFRLWRAYLYAGSIYSVRLVSRRLSNGRGFVSSQGLLSCRAYSASLGPRYFLSFFLSFMKRLSRRRGPGSRTARCSGPTPLTMLATQLGPAQVFTHLSTAPVRTSLILYLSKSKS